jgi:hypothetical protein
MSGLPGSLFCTLKRNPARHSCDRKAISNAVFPPFIARITLARWVLLRMSVIVVRLCRKYFWIGLMCSFQVSAYFQRNQ